MQKDVGTLATILAVGGVTLNSMATAYICGASIKRKLLQNLPAAAFTKCSNVASQ